MQHLGCLKLRIHSIFCALRPFITQFLWNRREYGIIGDLLEFGPIDGWKNMAETQPWRNG